MNLSAGASAAAYRLPLTILLVVGFTLVKFIPVFLLVAWFVQSTHGELDMRSERAFTSQRSDGPLQSPCVTSPPSAREASSIRNALRIRGL